MITLRTYLSMTDDEIDHDKTDTFKPWLRQPDTSDVLNIW